MTNVNNTLSEKDRTALTKQLVQMFSADTTQNESIFNALYTPAEQVLSIKRLAVIVMLREGYTTYRIAQALDMSHSTVLRHKQRWQEGSYDAIVQAVQKKTFNQERFWRILETLLRAGLPPMAGPGRWQSIAPAAVRGSRSRK